MEDKGRKLLEGAVDFHIHTEPDVFPRIASDIEIAQQAKEWKMRAVLIKSHVTITADRAKIASQQTQFDVFGGLALNYPVGGLNPHAVDVAIRFGAKQIWMPTFQSAHYLKDKTHVPMFAKMLPEGLEGITILNGKNKIKPEVKQILEKIAENEIVLGTGHLSVKESMILVKEAKKMGVKKIVVTHPLAPFINFTVQEMKDIISEGATMLEHVFNDCTHQVSHPISPPVIAKAIKEIGARYCILASDGGQVINPPPREMMLKFVEGMLKAGVSAEEIRMMVSDNPKRMLSIE